MKAKYKHNGKELTKEEFDALPKKEMAPHGVLRSDHEMASDALGVQPDQVEEYAADARRRGLTGITWLPDGRPVFDSIRAKRAYEQSQGFFNRSDFL